LASLSVFRLIIGLFLVYGYQYEYLLDRQRDVENGTRYLVLNAAIVFILSNLTVAIDYLSRPEIHLVQKTTFFTLMLVAYLFVTYLFNDFFKSGFETKRRNAVFRLVACLSILAFSLTAAIDTRITISLDTVVVYLVALHEMHFRWNNTTEEELPPLVSFFITGGDSEDD
jgi:O-antigen ligase